VVEFSCGTRNEVAPGILIKPKAERLSPHQEEDSSDELSVCEVSSVHSLSNEPMSVPVLFAMGDGDQLSSAVDDEKSRSDDDGEPSMDSDDSENEDVTSSHVEPSILPQRSILHENESIPGSRKTSARKAYDVSMKAKRVLSSNTLASLNAEAGHKDDSPKRMRTSPELEQRMMDELPELNLGLPVMDFIRPPPLRYSLRPVPAISIDDDDELDRALSEELKRSSNIVGGDNSPVPLLTPPQSPLAIPSEQDNVLVEWPSNLVVDNAIMSAVNDTRPLSPSSLEGFEEEEEEVRPKGSSFARPDPSTLTPLLRSISVGIQ
jgi:hypothetical protein